VGREAQYEVFAEEFRDHAEELVRRGACVSGSDA